MGGTIEIVKTGLGCSLQDRGRMGWKRFGVPPSGAMDPHAAAVANRLAGNAEGVPVLELLMQGAELRVMAACRLAVTGADGGSDFPCWHGTHLAAGATVAFPHNRSGLWTYVAIKGGFDAPRILGSASAYPRGGLGVPIKAGDILASSGPGTMPRNIGGTWAPLEDRRNYETPPVLRVWPGPQWEWFEDPADFFAADWQVSSRSDRTGYRLEGAVITPPEREMTSEPVLAGSIQVPPDGRPIVTMRDGPTVGGYPKIGLVDADSLSWLAQCRPGVRIRFEPAP